MPKSVYPTLPFPIDHIIARYHGGKTELSNLAYSCLHCNSHKGPNIAGIDPVTRKLTKLYHPRRHNWSTHFRWQNAVLVGRTAMGRTTVMVLHLNDLDLVEVRERLMEDGVRFE